MITSSGIFERVKDWHVEEWFALLYESTSGATVDGLPMPTFPPAEVQTAIHGHANEVSVREAILFYEEVVRYARAAGRRISPEHSLLDFGTGWGRMLRPFMRDLPGSNMYGCEPDSERIVLARQCNPYVNFIQSPYSPPLRLRASTIDLVTAWSVFSHLNESATNEWIVELTRMLTPGGLMFITTQGTGFFEFCERLHAEKKQQGSLSQSWHETLVAQFPDPAEARRRYDSGEYVWEGWLGDQYGEAAISLEYVRSHWLRDLELVAFVDDSARLPETLIVLQRPELPGLAAASPADKTRRAALSQDPKSLLDSSFQALAPPAVSPGARPVWGTSVANYPSWVSAWHETRAPVHALGCYVVQGGTWHFPGMLETGRGNYATEDDVLVRYVRDMWREGQFPARSARPAETEDPMILVFDRGYTTYGHFLVDILPRLLIAEQTLGSAFADCSVFVPADVPAWAERALSAVGFDASRFYRFDWHTNSLTVRIAIVPTLAHAYYSFHPRAVEIFREIRRRAAPEIKGGSRRLFMSRRGQHSNRRLLNRARIEEIARQAGLEVVTPETLSFREQIALYGGSSLMVGEYGSALHNSIFMPRGSGVIALNPLQYLQSWLGALNEENTMYLYPEGADGLMEFVEFVIDEDRFARALEFAVSDVTHLTR